MILETLWDILLATVFMILGWFGREWISELTKKYNKKNFEKKASLLKEKGKQWLVNYYVDNRQGDFLYTLPNGKKIPYLTKESWHGAAIENSTMRYTIHDERCLIEVESSFINERRRIGQNIWDGNTLCLNGILETGNEINLNLIHGTYFQYLTVSSNLANEMYECIISQDKSPVFRNHFARVIHHLENGDLGAQILGFTVALVFNIDGKLKILLQERSKKTGIAAGYYAVVPAFVCDPANLNSTTLPIDVHHFLLEFFEELYDQEELVKNNKYFSQDWFYEQEPVKTMIAMYDKGDFIFDILGFGFDGNTGELNVAALAYIKDSNFAKKELRKMTKNWEINGMQLIDINSDELSKIMYSDTMYITGAFTLSCMLKKLSIVSDNSPAS